MATPETLKYFQTIDVKDHKEAFKALEDILQQEHLPDGRHPIASEASDGFLSAYDYQRLKRLLDWFEKSVTQTT